MRYVRLLVENTERYGVLDGDRITILDGDPITGRSAPTPRTVQVDEAQLLVPCRPTKIVGVGLNYYAHAREMNKSLPEEPLLFLKPPSALLPTGATIERPPGYTRVDYEGELCVVIGRRTRNSAERNALERVFGYTIMNDVTVRDLQKRDVQYTRAKGFDTFAPVGPCIATDLDPTALTIETRVNGELRQSSSTGDLIFSVAQLVSFISRVMTLEPGDLITTGTPPGVGNLIEGDTVEVRIDAIGTLINSVKEIHS